MSQWLSLVKSGPVLRCWSVILGSKCHLAGSSCYTRTLAPLPKLRRTKYQVQLDCRCSVQYSQERYASSDVNDQTYKEKMSFSHKLASGPSLEHFIKSSRENDEFTAEISADSEVCDSGLPPYISASDVHGSNRSVFIETYGCQMNNSDTEIAWSILKKSGYLQAPDIKEADVILVMTCAIREGAEQKIWKRLDYFKSLKIRRQKRPHLPELKIGILGCMAERLKAKIVEKEKKVDLVCGPDSYRDLPRMLATTESGQSAVNVLLSLDETYADVTPVRLSHDSPSAFVSIMRGCDNMCTYCIVPFTRGRERSRPIESILEEVRHLSQQGVKEVTLLGQNVNSYRDASNDAPAADGAVTQLSAGFRTVYKPKLGGRRFADLLDRVSLVDPEMRIRFTSPHPKDFPDEVLYLVRDRPNICRQIHLPAQSGSSRMLEVMGRGYTRQAYIDLVLHIRSIVPDVSLSSDFIAGFCGETEDDHLDTVSLLRLIRYNFAFCFPYSMRQKTRAHRRLVDDVEPGIKSRRHDELIRVFREEAQRLNEARIGQKQLILVEGVSKRSNEELVGRSDSNVKVIIPRQPIPLGGADVERCDLRAIQPGDYVAVEITGATSQVMRGKALFHTTLAQYSNDWQPTDTIRFKAQTVSSL